MYIILAYIGWDSELRNKSFSYYFQKNFIVSSWTFKFQVVLLNFERALLDMKKIAKSYF